MEINVTYVAMFKDNLKIDLFTLLVTKANFAFCPVSCFSRIVLDLCIGSVLFNCVKRENTYCFKSALTIYRY